VLKLVDPKATLKFIPESVKGDDKPVTFHIKPEDNRLRLKRKTLLRLGSAPDGKGFVLGRASDDDWLDYYVARIDRIENVEGVASDMVREILERLPGKIGMEVEEYITEHSEMMLDQVKN
jgi:hypothetical protein